MVFFEEIVLTEVITTKETPIFVRKKHALDELARKIARITPQAVDILEDMMNSDDEKIKFNAAKQIIDFHADIEIARDKSDLSRQIAEIAAKGRKTPLELVGGEEPKELPPVTDFSTIQEVL